mgnify:CR=1 FL=1
MRNTMRSQSLFGAAQELIPGGVDSPVRAFRAVGGQPPSSSATRIRLW